MGLYNIFHTKIDDWKEIDSRTKKSLEDFRKYLDSLLFKITVFQEIYVKLIDFENNHIFEQKEKALLGGTKGRWSSAKLYEHYFRLIKRRLSKLSGEAQKAFVCNRDEEKDVVFVHKKISAFCLAAEEEDKFLIGVPDFEKKIGSLAEILSDQMLLMQKTDAEFRRFVGNESKWERDYRTAAAQNSRYYADVLEKKQEIFDEWRDFISKINLIKSSIKEEIVLVTGKNPGDDIVCWKTFVSGKFGEFAELETLDNILKKTRKIVCLSKERMEIYHCTENIKIVPLLESIYPHGFYFCTEDAKYAVKIKSDQFQEVGSRLNTFTISIPKTLFREIAVEDANHGKDGDQLSIKAYEHSFFVPVSKYLLYNHYVSEGLIVVKN